MVKARTVRAGGAKKSADEITFLPSVNVPALTDEMVRMAYLALEPLIHGIEQRRPVLTVVKRSERRIHRRAAPGIADTSEK
jgi:hypothetical protein